jgi:cytochrome c553
MGADADEGADEEEDDDDDPTKLVVCQRCHKLKHYGQVRQPAPSRARALYPRPFSTTGGGLSAAGLE